MRFLSPALLAAIFYAAGAPAADLDNGDDLHFEHCTGCHDSTAYTREDRKVTSLAGLGSQVRFCRDNLGLAWFDDEVDDVIAYLNATYYHY